MTEAQLENARIVVAVNATPEEEFDRVYHEHSRWLREGRKGADPVNRLAAQIADKVNIWESKYGDAASSSTQDAIHYNERDGSVLFTGDDAINIGQRVGVYSDTEAKRLLRAQRAESKKREDAMATRTKDERESDEKDDPDADAVHYVSTLAELNRVHRRKYGQRPMGTKDLAPIHSLRDLNLRNRFGRYAA